MTKKKKTLYPAYVSKNSSNLEKKVIILMIPNGEKRKAKSIGCKSRSEVQRRAHYLAVKKLSALLRGITSTHYSDFYCLNCPHSFRTKIKH